MEPIVVMRIETDQGLNSVVCKDGERRIRFYEITDQGTIIQYLAGLEDSREEYIVEMEKELDKGLEEPYVFSLVEACGVGSFTYTPQVSIGYNAALGAALGGAAGAVIGAATAAQANANAPSYQLPVSFSTGSHYLKFNGERLFSVELYPYSDVRVHYPLLGQSAREINYDARKIMEKEKHQVSLFGNEWIENKYGKARGFYGKYDRNYYNKSTGGDTLAKHIEFFSTVVAYYCMHRGEIGALDEYCSVEKTIAPEKLFDDAQSVEGKSVRGTVSQNLKLIKDRTRWCEEKRKAINEQYESDIRTLDEAHLQRKEELRQRASELSEKKQQLENEISAFGVFQMKAKRKTQEALAACLKEQEDIAGIIDEEAKDYIRRQETIIKNRELNRNSLLAASREQFPQIPYAAAHIDASFLDGLINTFPKEIAEQEEKVASIIQLLYLSIIDGQMLTTKEIADVIKAAYSAIWNEEMLPDHDTSIFLTDWLKDFFHKYPNMILCVDEREYLDDFLWAVKKETHSRNAA